MKRSTASIVSTMLAAALCAVALAGCSSTEQQPADQTTPVIDVTDTSGGVAATVNGVEIGENAIVAYVDTFRQTNNLTDDESWGSYLGQNSYTPESLRETILESFINQEIVRQAAAENGVEVTDEEVEKAFDQAKASAGNESNWRIALKYSGLTENQYRDALRQQLLQQKLFYIATGTSQLDSLINQLTSTMREQGGAELADLIESAAAAFAEAAQTEQVKATDELVLSLIKAYESDYADAVSLDDVPQEVVSMYRTQADSVIRNEAFNSFMQEYVDSADVERADMPENLSYDVEVIVAEPAQQEGADDGADEPAEGTEAQTDAQ